MRRNCAMMLCVVFLVASLGGCTRGSGPDVGLVEFPGLKWSDTPEQVISKLNLADEQILENKMHTPGDDEEETEYDVWNLFIRDWSFLDSEVVGAHFVFVRYPGRSFGLARVQLYFSDDTDMAAVRAKMMEIYGAGTTEPGPVYRFADGELVSEEENMKQSENGLPHFWYATVTGTEVLSAQAVEGYVQHIASSDAAVGREAAIEYLNFVPVVSVSCSDRNTDLDLKSETQSTYITRKTVTFDASQMVHILQQFEK